MVEFTTWDILRNLLLAARWTVLLSLVAFVGGRIFGLLVTFARVGHSRVGRAAARVYIEIVQDTPLLMQLFLCFFGLALLGLDVPPLTAAAVALTLYTSAFLAEIWRGCVEAIPKDQWEASTSLALSYPEQMHHVTLPQALKIAVSPSVGFLVQVVKGTALASIIGFVELTKAGTTLNNATFQSFHVYGMVAAIYFALWYPLSLSAKALERRLNASSRPACSGREALRRPPRPQGRRPRRRGRRGGRHHRPQRLRQVNPAPLYQRSRDLRRWLADRRRHGRRRGQVRPAPAAPDRGHGLPEL